METIIQFWQTKLMEEFTKEEWESLCDHCGRCCLHKLEDEDSGEILFTNVCCQFLDLQTCSCTDYVNRSKINPECIPLTKENVKEISWLPSTCAYRLIAYGMDLPWWHPLVSGDPDTVKRAGISIGKRAVLESKIDMDNLENYVVFWVD